MVRAKTKKGAKSGRKRSAKMSRFNLSRRGEIVLASMGGLILALVLIGSAWLWLAPRLKSGPSEAQQREAKLAAEAEKTWAELQTRDILRGIRDNREDVLVDGEKWAALTAGEREAYAGAAARHLGGRRCFVFDAASGQRLGWFQEGTGYRVVPRDASR
jgi:hypothetical protein